MYWGKRTGTCARCLSEDRKGETSRGTSITLVEAWAAGAAARPATSSAARAGRRKRRGMSSFRRWSPSKLPALGPPLAGKRHNAAHDLVGVHARGVELLRPGRGPQRRVRARRVALVAESLLGEH